MNRLRYREKRAGERRKLYLRDVCLLLLVSLAVSSIYTRKKFHHCLSSAVATIDLSSPA